MKNKTISLGADHAGFPYKDDIKRWLITNGFQVVDHGTNSEESVDYPDYVHPVGNDIDTGKSEMGIVMCGSGNGVAITINKHKKVRAALCWTTEIASLARRHNDANVLAIPVRFVSKETALAMVKIFVETDFEGGRHERRVKKISEF